MPELPDRVGALLDLGSRRFWRTVGRPVDVAYSFDETVAWLATQAAKSTVTELMRIAWRTVGSINTRVWDDIGRVKFSV